MENSNAGVREESEAKISDLPDALIYHILSFLPTKCVMSTCILSKRWKYVVNSIPILDFRNWRTLVDTRKERKLETKWFMNFLDTVIFMHDKPNIQKFYLDLDEFFDESRVNRWISTIMKRKIEEFGLSLKMLSASSIFPLSFFTCDSLTLLDFAMATIAKFIIPTTVSFPKLKILRLTSVNIVDETSTRKLFSNCPVLEELSLSRCLMSQGLCIANSSLKHLSISSCYLNQSTVKISAPYLMTISYKGFPPADFVLDSFPSLVEADVSFGYMHKTFFKLFQKLSSAKLLKIYANPFLVLGEADILSTSSLTFNNLIHLEFNSKIYIPKSGSSSVSSVRIFFRFLQLSPNVESILFAHSIHILDEEDDDCWSLDPKCPLSHLKSIKFEYFDGEPAELNAAKLFLKYAGFLGTVTIVASPKLSEDHKEQINAMQQLLMFPKPAKCVVRFSMSSGNA